jgi:hypothetical protein
MGLLDEAIKEHLELKRRHGADPGEVARLEHEALGPARREPVEAPVMDEQVDEDAAPVAEQADAQRSEARAEPVLADDDDYADEVPAEERLEAPARRVEPEPEPEAEAPEDVEQPTAQFSLQELEAASEEEEGAAAAAPAEAEPEELAVPEEAAEPDKPAEPEPHADVVPADEEPDSDDVLEETPEFLQETPEHDRLWFEQKPPRDFDF